MSAGYLKEWIRKLTAEWVEKAEGDYATAGREL
jgi:hypothetical protein